MKYLALLLLLPLVAFKGAGEDEKVVKPLSYENKDIYVIHMPNCDHEFVGNVQLTREEAKGTITDRVEALIEKANEEFGGEFDAVYTRGGNVARCIKYTSEEKSTGRLVGLWSKDVFIMSTPSDDYQKIKEIDVPTEMGYMAIPQFGQWLVDQAISAEKDGQQVDAVLYSGGSKATLIKY